MTTRSYEDFLYTCLDWVVLAACCRWQKALIPSPYRPKIVHNSGNIVTMAPSQKVMMIRVNFCRLPMEAYWKSWYRLTYLVNSSARLPVRDPQVWRKRDALVAASPASKNWAVLLSFNDCFELNADRSRVFRSSRLWIYLENCTMLQTVVLDNVYTIQYLLVTFSLRKGK